MSESGSAAAGGGVEAGGALAVKSLRPRRNKNEAKNNLAAYPELEALPDLFANLCAGEWLKRKLGLEEIVQFMEEYPKATRTAMVRIFDHFAPLLNDNNRKVQLTALESLDRVLAFQEGLEEVANALIPALANNLAANNAVIKSQSMELITKLVAVADCAVLLPILCNTTLYGKMAGKADMINLLTDVQERMQLSGDPALVERHVLPCAASLLSEVKGDIRQSTARLWRSLYASMGTGCWGKGLKAGNVKLVQSIVGYDKGGDERDVI
jgi:hypothetical protein